MIKRTYPWAGLRSQVGKSFDRRKSEAMLLDIGELPGVEWRPESRHSWRVGSPRIQNEEARRAHGLGLFASVRFVNQSKRRAGIWEVKRRGLMVEAIPYVSSKDARSMIPKLWQGRVATRRLTVLEEQVIEGRGIADLADACFIEQRTVGRATAIKVVLGRVDHVALAVACVTYREDWSWDEVRALASLQARKVRKILAPG